MPIRQHANNAAPNWVPANIWALHVQQRQAENYATSPHTSPPVNGTTRTPTSGELKRRSTMMWRKLNRAVLQYVHDDQEAALDLMRRMNLESRQREAQTAHVVEAMPDVLNGTQLLDLIGARHLQQMTRHDWFSRKLLPGIKGYTYTSDDDWITVQAMTVGDNSHMLSFKFSVTLKKLVNVSEFRWDGDSRNLSGRKMWQFIKNWR